MDCDIKKADLAIALAKYKVASPEMVYEALRDDRDHICSRERGEAIADVLLARNDPLINIGLAQYGGIVSVVFALYRRGVTGSSDAVYDRGLRLAALSNQNIEVKAGKYGLIDGKEFSLMVHGGDEDEVTVMMANPTNAHILYFLYAQKPPLDDVPVERLCDLVRATINNPAINAARHAEGQSWQGQDEFPGIYDLMRSVPVEAKWLYVLTELLTRIAPAALPIPDTDPLDILARWSELKPNAGAQNGEGWARGISAVDEFRCLVALHYGNFWSGREIQNIGGPDNSDVALRCAFYGKGKLTAAQMSVGYQRDRDVFLFAALRNDNLYRIPENRAQLENFFSDMGMPGNLSDESENIRLTYARQCRQRFSDPRPVTVAGAEALLCLVQEPSAEITALAVKIDAQTETLNRRIDRQSRMAIWGFVILLAILLFFKH